MARMALALTSALALCAAASLPLVAAAATGPDAPDAWSRSAARGVDAPVTPRPTPAPASNMGFRCEHHLPTVQGFQNIYLVSVPGFFGQSDIADSSAANPCTGAPDGVINADDVLCDWWTSRQGSMTISRRDDATESWQSRMASADDATGAITFSGGWTAPLPAREAFYVTVTPPASGDVDNAAVIVGSHDPADPGHLMSVPPSGNDLVTLLNVPYSTMYQRAAELICGLEGADYRDLDGDHVPDPGTCINGLMYAQPGPVTIEVARFDNTADGAPTDDTWVRFAAHGDPVSGDVTFTGPNFDLSPCEAYLITIEPPYRDWSFISPTF